jgi:uncharacterized membrane protein YfcA
MLVLGVSVGMISAALGLGGGIFMVPAFLEFIPGMDAGTAKGTSLFIIIFVAMANIHRLGRGVDARPWGLAALMAAGSICGAYASGWITTLLPERVEIWIFVALILGAAARTFLLKPVTVRDEDIRRRRVAAVLIGLAAGIIAGATGVGGGALLVPLALLAGLVTNERVVLLSNMVMVATCISGSLAHFMAEKSTEMTWTYGQVNIALAPLVFIGAQAGGPIGRWINDHLPLQRRKIALGVILLIIAGRLAYKALGVP